MRKIDYSPYIGLATLMMCFIATAYAEDNQTDYLVLSWSYSPSDYVNKVSVTDLNGDGAYEVIASTRDGMVYCLGTMFKSHLNWGGPVLMDGNVRAVVLGDIDGDGKTETLIGTDESENNIKLVDWLGLNKGSSIDFNKKVLSLDMGDVDGNGKKDIVIGSADAGVYLFGFDSEESAWSVKTGGPVYYVSVSDLDGDGKNEVAALSIWTDNELEKAEVSVINSGGIKVWTYQIEGGVYSYSTSDFVVSDLNGDGKQEIAIGTAKKGVVVIGHDGAALWSFPTDNLVSALYPADLSGGKAKTLIVGSAPNLYAFDSAGQVEWRFPVNTTVYGIVAADIDSDGGPEILVGANKYLHVLTVGGELLGTQNRGIQIVGFGKAPAVKNVDARSISAGDIDGDGRIEAVVGYGWTESRVDSNYNLGEISVYKVNDKYDKYTGVPVTSQAAPTTTMPPETSTSSTVSSSSSSTSMAQGSEEVPENPATSTTQAAIKEQAKDQTPWQAIVLLLLAALMMSVVIMFFLYRRSKPKEVTLNWPPGQDI